MFGLSGTGGALEAAAPSPWPTGSDVNVQLDGVTSADGEIIPLPLGSVLVLGQDVIKGTFVALGPEGRHLTWGLARRMRLAEVGDAISALTAADGPDPLATALAGARFGAGARHALLGPRLLDGATLPDTSAGFADTDWPFDDVTMAVSAEPSLSFVVETPSLPCRPGGECEGFTEGLTVQLAVAVVGAGAVPLGVTAAADDPDPQDALDQLDGVVDVAGFEPGFVTLRASPPHDGLEGRPAFLLATSRARDDTGAMVGLAGSLARVDEMNSAVALPGFLPFSSGSYTGSQATLSAPAGADVVRLRLDDEDGVWSVWARGSITALDLTSLRPAAITGRDARATLQAATLDDTAPADLFALGGAHLGHLDAWLSSFSSLTCVEGGSGCDAAP